MDQTESPNCPSMTGIALTIRGSNWAVSCWAAYATGRPPIAAVIWVAASRAQSAFFTFIRFPPNLTVSFAYIRTKESLQHLCWKEIKTMLIFI